MSVYNLRANRALNFLNDGLFLVQWCPTLVLTSQPLFPLVIGKEQYFGNYLESLIHGEVVIVKSMQSKVWSIAGGVTGHKQSYARRSFSLTETRQRIIPMKLLVPRETRNFQ